MPQVTGALPSPRHDARQPSAYWTAESNGCRSGQALCVLDFFTALSQFTTDCWQKLQTHQTRRETLSSCPGLQNPQCQRRVRAENTLHVLSWDREMYLNSNHSIQTWVMIATAVCLVLSAAPSCTLNREMALQKQSFAKPQRIILRHIHQDNLIDREHSFGLKFKTLGDKDSNQPFSASQAVLMLTAYGRMRVTGALYAQLCPCKL